MEIKVQRTYMKGEITEGQLTIDGQLICDTLENTESRLSAGTYPLLLVKCKQYARKMISIQANPQSLILTEEDCYNCPKLKEVFPNTIIPKRCPMLKAGNGIHGHHDGSILVGKQAAHGLLIHPRAAFDTLYERIRKNLERRREVTLVIEECP